MAVPDRQGRRLAATAAATVAGRGGGARTAAAPRPAPPVPVRPPVQVFSPRSSVGPLRSAPPPSGGPAPVPAPAAKPRPEDYIGGDQPYQEQLAALNAALSNYRTDNTNQLSQYDTSYADAVKNLGWSAAPKGAVDNPDTPNIDESAGAWNFNDLNTASGKGYQNQLNDFAGRGVLQSSLYATALDNLRRSLKDQLTGMDTAKSAFQTNKANELAQYTNANGLQKSNAYNEALQRIAASFL